MTTKMFFGNQYVGSFVCDGKKYTKWQRRMLKLTGSVTRIIKAVTFTTVIAWAFVIGLVFKFSVSEPVQAGVIVEETIDDVPIMEAIADCESGDRLPSGKAKKGSARHIDPNTGQVFTKANDNKTVDIGRYMVNEYYHGKAASKMGLDLTKEKDNKKMAYHLYATQGTEPWSASKSCWISY